MTNTLSARGCSTCGRFGFVAIGVIALALGRIAQAEAPKDQTYMPVVPTKSFDEVYKQDTGDKDRPLRPPQSSA